MELLCICGVCSCPCAFKRIIKPLHFMSQHQCLLAHSFQTLCELLPTIILILVKMRFPCFFFIIKRSRCCLNQNAQSTKNAHRPYIETVPLKEPSGLLYGCDVTTIVHIGRKCRYSSVTVISRLQWWWRDGESADAEDLKMLTNQSRLGFFI